MTKDEFLEYIDANYSEDIFVSICEILDKPNSELLPFDTMVKALESTKNLFSPVLSFDEIDSRLTDKHKMILRIIDQAQQQNTTPVIFTTYPDINEVVNYLVSLGLIELPLGDWKSGKPAFLTDFGKNYMVYQSDFKT